MRGFGYLYRVFIPLFIRLHGMKKAIMERIHYSSDGKKRKKIAGTREMQQEMDELLDSLKNE